MAASAYLTRHCLAVANTTIQGELGFTNEDFGLLYAAFSLGYLLFQVPGGWLGQRFGTRTVMPLLSTIWSLLTVVLSMVSSLWVMCASRFGFGLAQAGMVPNQAKVVKDWFPPEVRGKVSSVVAMSMSLGGAITMAITGVLLAVFGWRDLFKLYSLVGIIWAVAFFFFFRTRPEKHTWVNQSEVDLIRGGETESETDDEAPTTPPLFWASAFRTTTIWLLCVQLVFKAAGYNFFVTFFPAYLEYNFKINPDNAGILTMLPLLGVVFGALTGGTIIDWILKRTGSKWQSRCGFASWALAATGVFVVLATFTQVAWMFATVIALGAFFSGMVMPCPWAASIDMGGRRPALVMGLMNSAGCLAGICISPQVGMLMDHIKATGGEWSLVIFVHAAFYMTAAICWFFVNPNIVVGKNLPRSKRLATCGLRIAAGIIDLIIIGIMFLLINIAYVYLLPKISVILISIPDTIIYLIPYGATFLAALAYFVIMENSAKQGTIGKLVFGIKVVNHEGGRIGFSRAVARHFVRLISVPLLGLWYLVMHFSKDKLSLDDKFTGTEVRDKFFGVTSIE